MTTIYKVDMSYYIEKSPLLTQNIHRKLFISTKHNSKTKANIKALTINLIKL